MSRVVAWTGHRPDLFLDPDAARQAVHNVGHELVTARTERFVVGGQRGVDTWAAQSALAEGIPYSLILPFAPDEFARDWSAADRSQLFDILAQASDVLVAGGYFARNKQLATHADLLVAVWTRTAGGGTSETIDLARRRGTPVREVILDASQVAATAFGRGI
jgi:predicted Rossmann-fold nucleotide-binding protein